MAACCDYNSEESLEVDLCDAMNNLNLNKGM